MTALFATCLMSCWDNRTRRTFRVGAWRASGLLILQERICFNFSPTHEIIKRPKCVIMEHCASFVETALKLSGQIEQYNSWRLFGAQTLATLISPQLQLGLARTMGIAIAMLAARAKSRGWHFSSFHHPSFGTTEKTLCEIGIALSYLKC